MRASQGRKASPRKLLADGMLGRLAKWLRLLGYDTVYDSDADDDELARRARAEGRLLLTRDRELADRRGLRTLFVGSETLEEQVSQVQADLGAPPDPALSRCSVCNEPLEEATPEEVAGQVPPYVLRVHGEFRRCPHCGRVYWPGSHVDAMARQVDGFGSHS
jgi:uncharacterized protein with PIN domain